MLDLDYTIRVSSLVIKLHVSIGLFIVLKLSLRIRILFNFLERSLI